MQTTIFESAARSVQARARIRDHIYQTPLIPARTAGLDSGSQVLFKAENFQRTGSFKIRGAAAKMTSQAAGGRLITASSGNHGIGSACAAKAAGQNLTVVLPEIVVPAKLEKIRSYGVDVILHGAETGLAEAHAQKLAAEEGFTYVSPYNDAEVMAGQGTIALEILEQCARADNVFVAMGGGGLISGIGAVLRSFSPKTRVFGAAAQHSQALADSMAAGRIVETEHLDTLADAVAGGVDEDSITLPMAIATVDAVVSCSEEEIREALRALAFGENMIVEGAAALAYAAWRKVAGQLAGQTSVILLCGANFDQAMIHRAIFGA